MRIDKNVNSLIYSIISKMNISMSVNKKGISPEDFEQLRKLQILLNFCVKYKILTEEEAEHCMKTGGELPGDIVGRLWKASLSKN